MEEKNITEQESLAIIQEMIGKSRQQLVDRSKYFFMWGFAVLGCAILQYVLLKINPERHDTDKVWVLMPVLAVIHFVMAFKDRKQEKVITHTTNATGALWLALGIGFFILAFLATRLSFEILPLLILFYGIGTFVTGKIIQFTPLVFGGISCFILSVAVTYVHGPEQLLILALSVTTSYIIPGILLKKEFRNEQTSAA